MKILGIQGSPVQRGTHFLLEGALEGVRSQGADSALLELTDYTIEHCRGCDSCLREKQCVIEDDLTRAASSMESADGLILAAPSYFASIPANFKAFLDRTRYLKMDGHRLADKPFAALASSGLKQGGGEHVIEFLHRFALLHGMVVIGGKNNPVTEPGWVVGTRKKDDGNFRKITDDEEARKLAEKLGERLTAFAKKLSRGD